MSSRPSVTLKTMIITGVLLLPTAVPQAIQDLADLKTIIDSTAAIIDAAPNNSSWGFFSPASPAGSLGTADLIGNISSTILRAKYLLDVDKVAWTTMPNNTTTPNATDSTSTEPPPSPTEAPTFPTSSASNISLDNPYTDYVSSIPTLANALIDLGRAWHKELNGPVADAISAFQQTITQFSTSMLENDMLDSQSILRTIRASSSLEDAQVAWSRPLNLPGTSGTKKRSEAASRRQLSEDQFYTHKDLWGRQKEVKRRQGKELLKMVGSRRGKEPSKMAEPDVEASEGSDTKAAWGEWRIEKIARRFVA